VFSTRIPRAHVARGLFAVDLADLHGHRVQPDADSPARFAIQFLSAAVGRPLSVLWLKGRAGPARWGRAADRIFPVSSSSANPGTVSFQIGALFGLANGV